MPNVLKYEDIQQLEMVWIDVNIALPACGVEVICFCPDKIAWGKPPVTALSRYVRYAGDIGYYWDNNHGHDGNYHSMEAVTMWMPLPKPPGIDV